MYWSLLLRALHCLFFNLVRPISINFVDSNLCHLHGQLFQVPKISIEFRSQAIGRSSHRTHSRTKCTPQPPGMHGFKIAPYQAEQSDRPHLLRMQLASAAGFALNPLGRAVFPAPLTAGFTPIRLVSHNRFLALRIKQII